MSLEMSITMYELMKTSLLVIILSVVVKYIPSVFQRRSLPEGFAGGYAAPGWRKVADKFREHLDSGWQKGGAIAVYHKGELVVEFSGGYADENAYWPFSKDTVSQFMSTTKVASAIVMGILVDRGLLDYTKPVAYYWPEFGQHGKEHITVEQLLSHQAGLVALDDPYFYSDLIKKEGKLKKQLESQSPNWEPGTGIGYHGVTLGLYMDQLVKRVDKKGRSLSQFFRDEIAKPFDIDFFIGLPKEENYRCARVYMFSILSTDLIFGTKYWPTIWKYATDSQSLIAKSVTNPKDMGEQDGIENNPVYRAIPGPGTHGYGTATGLAKLLGILATGGTHEGKTLISKPTIQRISQQISTGHDKVLLMNMTYGRGVTLRTSPQGETIFGAPGSGGQMSYCDPENQLAWAYLTNHMSLYAIGDDPKYLQLENAIYDSLRTLSRKH